MKKTEFNKLKSEWYKRLAESGFEDIEQDEIYLKRGMSLIDPRRVTWESQAEYYQMATYFLNEYKFKSNLERTMWEYHMNGISVRDIAQTLGEVLKRYIPRMNVWRVINLLERAMFKKYGVTKWVSTISARPNLRIWTS